MCMKDKKMKLRFACVTSFVVSVILAVVSVLGIGTIVAVHVPTQVGSIAVFLLIVVCGLSQVYKFVYESLVFRYIFR